MKQQIIFLKTKIKIIGGHIYWWNTNYEGIDYGITIHVDIENENDALKLEELGFNIRRINKPPYYKNKIILVGLTVPQDPESERFKKIHHGDDSFDIDEIHFTKKEIGPTSHRYVIGRVNYIHTKRIPRKEDNYEYVLIRDEKGNERFERVRKEVPNENII